MLKKSKIKKQTILPENLNLSFRFAKIQTSCNPEVYDDEQCSKIINIVNIISKSITIDYTFVNHKNTKYEKTFITEEGWNQLCKILNQTNFGTICNKDDNAVINEAYQLIMIQYVYQTLEDLGYDIANICLEMLSDSKYTIEVRSLHFADNYKGKWQNW